MQTRISFSLLPRRRALALAFVGLLLPAVLSPIVARAGDDQDSRRDPLVETVENGKGRINYGAGVVKATGYGAPPADGVAGTPSQAKLMALGAARADALRNLAMTVSSIQVTSETTVKNYVLQKDEIKTSLSAILKSPRVVSESMQPDGTAVVVMELPLYGPNSVASVIMPEVCRRSRRAEPVEETDAAVSAAAPAPAPIDRSRTSTFSTAGVRVASASTAGGSGADGNGNFKGPEQPAIKLAPPIPQRIKVTNVTDPGLTPKSDNGPFTSVIVDCRGLGVEAIMSPKIYDSTGREVYGTIRVSPEYAVETGIVSYPRSIGEAIRSARAGSHPLIVKAMRTADRFRFNPVISMEDADRILAANNRDRFLEQTRVILLVDPIR